MFAELLGSKLDLPPDIFSVQTVAKQTYDFVFLLLTSLFIEPSLSVSVALFPLGTRSFRRQHKQKMAVHRCHIIQTQKNNFLFQRGTFLVSLCESTHKQESARGKKSEWRFFLGGGVHGNTAKS